MLIYTTFNMWYSWYEHTTAANRRIRKYMRKKKVSWEEAEKNVPNDTSHLDMQNHQKTV